MSMMSLLHYSTCTTTIQSPLGIKVCGPIFTGFKIMHLLVSFTITMASFSVTVSQSTIGAAIPLLIAFDFLNNLFKREAQYSIYTDEELLLEGRSLTDLGSYAIPILIFFAIYAYIIWDLAYYGLPDGWWYPYLSLFPWYHS